MDKPVKMLTKTEELLDFDDVTRVYMQYLRWLTLLPIEGRDFTHHVSYLVPLYVMLNLMIVITMNTQSMINNLALGMIDIESIHIAVAILFGAMRYTLLINWRLDYKNLIDECKAIWSVCSGNEHTALLVYNRQLNIFFHALLVSSIAVYLAFACVSFLSWISAVRANNTELRQLPYKYDRKFRKFFYYNQYRDNFRFWTDITDKSKIHYRWFVEDLHESPHFEIALVIQLTSCLVAVFTMSTIEVAGPIIIIFNAGFFRALRNRLLAISLEQQLGNTWNDKHAYKRLIECVRFHQRLLNLSVNTDKITRVLFLLQYMGSGYVLALIGVQLLIVSDPGKYKSVPILIFAFVQLLIYQYAPEYLLQESEGVATAAYFIYTPLMGVKTRKCLRTILSRAQRPIVMTAGGIVQLSLKTFASIMSSTASFFIVLKNFAN